MRLATALAAAVLMLGVQAASAGSDGSILALDDGSIYLLAANTPPSSAPQTPAQTNPTQTPLQKCMHECGRQAVAKSKSCKDPDDEAQVECLGKERVEMHHCYAQCKKTHKTST